MGTYVVTGSASGMGNEAVHTLRAAGHTVIGVDIASPQCRHDRRRSARS